METNIDGDLPCAICGYNLKGLGVEGNCPECGQAVARTFSPELGHSSAAWLRRQSVTMFLLVAVGSLNVSFQGSYAPLPLRIAFNIIVLVAAIIGVFRLGDAEVPGANTGTFDPWRRGLRAAMVVLAGIDVVSFFPPFIDVRLWELLVLVSVVALMALDFLVGRFLYKLAQRSNDMALIGHARLVFWALPLQNVAIFAMGFLVRVSDSVPGRLYVLPTVNWLAGVVVLAYVVLLGRMHEMFRGAARGVEGSERAKRNGLSN